MAERYDVIGVLGKALTGLSVRQRVIADNIANVETPNFKAAAVRFEHQLLQAMHRSELPSNVHLVRTNPGHWPLEEDSREQMVPEINPQATTVLRNDGNNVDLEAEMVSLVETNVTYNALAQLVSSRLSLLRSILTGAGR